jgi:hypothetical protein
MNNKTKKEVMESFNELITKIDAISEEHQIDHNELRYEVAENIFTTIILIYGNHAEGLMKAYIETVKNMKKEHGDIDKWIEEQQ